MSEYLRAARRWVILLSAVVLLSSSLSAQSGTGQITGRLADPTGAIVPGAEVAIINVDTGDQRLVTTNENGNYTVTLLNPGNYRLEVKAEGFRAITRTGLKLDVAQTARIDFELEVGQVTETIEVTESAPLLESETAAVGQVVENRSIVEMPLNGRNAWYLTQLAGASVLVRGIGDAGEIPVTTVAGSRTFTQGMYVDGGSVQKTGLSRAMAEMAPMVDALEEFKVITNNYGAEYGRSAGGVFTAVTKSGTNQFHGNLFEFFRNDKLDARNFFAAEIAPLRYNQYGGTLGGPIVKDKTHFFVAYERTDTTSGTTTQLTVPTQAQRQGDFSTTVDAQGRILQLYDPATTRPHPTDATRKVRDPIANNQIPSALIDPVGAKAASFYVLPNRAGNIAGANNYLVNLGPKREQNHGTIRVDHTFNDKDRFFGRYLIQHNFTPQESVYPEPAASALGSASRNVKNIAQTMMGSWMHMFSTNIINDLKVSWLKQSRDVVHDSIDGNWPAQIGLTGVSDKAFPAFRPQGFSVIGGTTAVYRVQRGPTMLISDTVSYITGNHQVKTGFEYRWNGSTDEFVVSPSGDFTFSQQGTGLQGNNVTGNGFASMLLGFATQAQIRDSSPLTYRSHYYGMFVQDDWRITSKLTLNLGVRYDIETARKSPEDQGNAFDPVTINPIAGVPGILTFAGVNGVPRNNFDTDLNNIAPRFGFAYKPFGGETVVRGGYGIFFGNPDDVGGGAGPRAALGFATEVLRTSPDQNQTAAVILRQGFPAYQGPGPEQRTAGFNVGGPAEYFERSRRSPYSQQFNFGVQHQLQSVLLEAQYLANLGHKLTANNLNINQVHPSLVGLPGSIQSRRPYPQYTALNILSPNLGDSNYHALLLRAEKRYSNGLQFLWTYTFSKFMDNVDAIANGDFQGTPGTGYQDYYNRNLDYSLSPLDVKHNITFNVIYDLPLGKGRNWAKSGPLSQIVGGWQLSMLTTIFTGPVYGVVTQQNNCECSSAGGQRPNILRDPALAKDQRSVNQWFDTSAFTQPARFTFGDAARAVGRAPGSANFDIGINKNFQFLERFRLQFRAEMFNAFNKANFGIPGTSMGAPTFGVISSAAQARVVQFGMKLYF